MDNDPNETPRVRHKLERLLEKMRILGSRDVSITLHARPPNMNQAQFEERFVEGARKFCRMAAAHGARVHFRGENSSGVGGFDALKGLVARIGESNCTMAPMLAMEIRRCGGNIKCSPRLFAKIDAPLWYLSSCTWDENRQALSSAAPMAGGVVPDAVLIKNFKAIRTRSPRVVFDAVYPNLDAEYRDVSLWEKSK